METIDKGLKLVAAIDRLASLDAGTHVRVYYDPNTWLFYILHDDTLKILVPDDAVLLSHGGPSEFYTSINRILTRACKASLKW